MLTRHVHMATQYFVTALYRVVTESARLWEQYLPQRPATTTRPNRVGAHKPQNDAGRP